MHSQFEKDMEEFKKIIKENFKEKILAKAKALYEENLVKINLFRKRKSSKLSCRRNYRNLSNLKRLKTENGHSRANPQLLLLQLQLQQDLSSKNKPSHHLKYLRENLRMSLKSYRESMMRRSLKGSNKQVVNGVLELK